MQVPCGSLEIWRWRRTSCPSHMPLRRSEAHIMESCRVTSSHLRHSFQLSAHGLKSAAAELYRAFCVIPPGVSFPIAWSIVRWHSGRWACVFWWCSGLLRPVQLAVEWWGGPHPNTSLFPCNGLELKGRRHHVWSVFAWNDKTTKR